jgi:hypothetical protein
MDRQKTLKALGVKWLIYRGRTPGLDQQNGAGHGQDNRNPLRNGQGQAEWKGLLVITRELDKEPQYRTEHQVHPNDLAGGVLPPESPVEISEH